MKSLIFSLLLVLASSFSASFSMASAMALEPASAIAAEDSQIITDYLNDICGDTWCEGEYDLNFMNVVSIEQQDQMKYFVNFAAKNSYEENAIQQMVACEIGPIELIDAVVADLRMNRFASDAVMALDQQIDLCLEQRFY